MDTMLMGSVLETRSGDQGGAVLWLLEGVGRQDDPLKPGRRLQLSLSLPVTFYASGPAGRLRLLWSFCKGLDVPLELSRSTYAL